MKKIIKKIPFLYNSLLKIKTFFIGFGRKSYSQFGEDLVLSTFCRPDKKTKGFYVDIGAYHPKRFSNTYFFYKRGWSGINIDASPKSMGKFNKARKRDINLEVAVSNENSLKYINIYDESAYNTLDPKRANELNIKGIGIKGAREIRTVKLKDLLDIHLNKEIDFLSIDVEGLDLEVLKSNDWNKYNPKFILVELHFDDAEEILVSELYKFLKNKHYKLVSIIRITLLFKHEK